MRLKDIFKMPFPDSVAMQYNVFVNTDGNVVLHILDSIDDMYMGVIDDIKFMLECQSNGLIETGKHPYSGTYRIYKF